MIIYCLWFPTNCKKCTSCYSLCLHPFQTVLIPPCQLCFCFFFCFFSHSQTWHFRMQQEPFGFTVLSHRDAQARGYFDQVYSQKSDDLWLTGQKNNTACVIKSLLMLGFKEDPKSVVSVSWVQLSNQPRPPAPSAILWFEIYVTVCNLVNLSETNKDDFTAPGCAMKKCCYLTNLAWERVVCL